MLHKRVATPFSSPGATRSWQEVQRGATSAVFISQGCQQQKDLPPPEDTACSRVVELTPAAAPPSKRNLLSFFFFFNTLYFRRVGREDF